MLEELYRIKRFREQKAGSEVFRCQRTMEQCKRNVDHAKASLSDHREFRRFKEQSLFDEIKGRKIQIRVLERMRDEVARLREAEVVLQQKVLLAEKALQEVRQAWRERRRQHDLAAREKEKLVQWLKIHGREVAQALESREEMELEEFSVSGRGEG